MLRDYQIEGAKFLLAHHNALLADDMGLGKTATLLLAAKAASVQKMVVVCPAVVCSHWMREVEKWWPEADPRRIRGIKPTAPGINLFTGTPTITILNYDILTAHMKGLIGLKPDCLVLDESHYVKSKTAKRTKAALDLARNVQLRGGYVWLASGTPMPSRPVELIEQLRILNALKEFGGWERYVTRYCEGHQERIWLRGRNYKMVWKLDGSSHSEELTRLLKQNVMIRRLRSEAMPGITVLPPIVEPVDCSNETMRVYWTAERDIASFVAMNPDNAGMALVKLSILRRLIGEAKRFSVADWIEERVSGGEGGLVVFGHHVESLEWLAHNTVVSSVMIHGQVNDRKREEAIALFRTGDIPVLFATTPAAGIGIDLTPCHDVMFYELEWTSAAMRQAIDRCARHGAIAPISVTYLMAPGTVDQEMACHVAATASQVDAVMESNDVAQVAIAHLLRRARTGEQLRMEV